MDLVTDNLSVVSSSTLAEDEHEQRSPLRTLTCLQEIRNQIPIDDDTQMTTSNSQTSYDFTRSPVIPIMKDTFPFPVQLNIHDDTTSEMSEPLIPLAPKGQTWIHKKPAAQQLVTDNTICETQEEQSQSLLPQTACHSLKSTDISTNRKVVSSKNVQSLKQRQTDLTQKENGSERLGKQLHKGAELSKYKGTTALIGPVPISRSQSESFKAELKIQGRANLTECKSQVDEQFSQKLRKLLSKMDCSFDEEILVATERTLIDVLVVEITDLKCIDETVTSSVVDKTRHILPVVEQGLKQLITRHKIERESLTLQIQSSQRSKVERKALLVKVKTLAARQKQVFDLFKKFQEIEKNLDEKDDTETVCPESIIISSGELGGPTGHSGSSGQATGTQGSKEMAAHKLCSVKTSNLMPISDLQTSKGNTQTKSCFQGQTNTPVPVVSQTEFGNHSNQVTLSSNQTRAVYLQSSQSQNQCRGNVIKSSDKIYKAPETQSSSETAGVTSQNNHLQNHDMETKSASNIANTDREMVTKAVTMVATCSNKRLQQGGESEQNPKRAKSSKVEVTTTGWHSPCKVTSCSQISAGIEDPIANQRGKVSDDSQSSNSKSTPDVVQQATDSWLKLLLPSSSNVYRKKDDCTKELQKDLGKDTRNEVDLPALPGTVRETSPRIPPYNVNKEKVSNVSETKCTKAESLFSPPRRHDNLPDDTLNDNVSPTATSMSSDVFLVKAKELNKRIKKRQEASQSKYIYRQEASQSKYIYRQEILCSQEKVNTATEKIPSSQGRAFTTQVSQTKKQRQLEPTKRCAATAPSTFRIPGCTSTYPSTSKSARSQSAVKQTSGKTSKLDKKTTTTYPSMKMMLEAGTIQPGTNVLSAVAQGQSSFASILTDGSIQTADRDIYRTPMKWLSSLIPSPVTKRSKAYSMLNYKGEPLSLVCNRATISGNADNTNGSQSSQPITQVLQSQPVTSLISTVGQSKQVKVVVMDNNSTKQSCILIPVVNTSRLPVVKDGVTLVKNSSASTTINQLPEHLNKRNTLDLTINDAEQKLREILTYKIRLIRDSELIPCDDLPDNFWVDDFAKVTVDPDIWETVDQWK